MTMPVDMYMNKNNNYQDGLPKKYYPDMMEETHENLSVIFESLSNCEEIPKRTLEWVRSEYPGLYEDIRNDNSLTCW